MEAHRARLSPRGRRWRGTTVVAWSGFVHGRRSISPYDEWPTREALPAHAGRLARRRFLGTPPDRARPGSGSWMSGSPRAAPGASATRSCRSSGGQHHRPARGQPGAPTRLGLIPQAGPCYGSRRPTGVPASVHRRGKEFARCADPSPSSRPSPRSPSWHLQGRSMAPAPAPSPRHRPRGETAIPQSSSVASTTVRRRVCRRSRTSWTVRRQRRASSTRCSIRTARSLEPRP